MIEQLTKIHLILRLKMVLQPIVAHMIGLRLRAAAGLKIWAIPVVDKTLLGVGCWYKLFGVA
jgi:hypothetical protein